MSEGLSTTLRIRVQTKATRDEIVGWLDEETLKVRVAAAPIGGKANARLTRFLARVLDVPEAAIRIVRGEKTPRKLVVVKNLSASEVRKRIRVKG